MEEIFKNMFIGFTEFVHAVGPMWTCVILTVATIAIYGIIFGIAALKDKYSR